MTDKPQESAEMKFCLCGMIHCETCGNQVERSELLIQQIKKDAATIAELNAENERLRVFISKVHSSSTCSATVLVAWQVLNGHDVRITYDTRDA